MRNNAFDIEMQTEIVKQSVLTINSLFKQRVSKLEAQQENLANIVYVKIHSFYHFLQKIKFKGFGKWIVLSQCFKENHP